MNTLTIDVREYLFDRLPRHFAEEHGWLKGACLFHQTRDGAPFGVNVESGGFNCLSCGARGNLVSLVQRIEGFDTYDDAAAWLRNNYGDERDPDAPLVLTLKGVDLTPPAPLVRWKPPGDEILEPYRFRHAYLEQERGISELWQRRFEIGYDRARNAITFPWRDRKGALITVKFRPTWTKGFWYTPVPQGVKKRLLYGLHHVARRKDRVVFVVEAEIDAITLWQAGHAAVAVGGSNFSDEQALELALAGVETVVACGDRDDAGAKLNAQVERKMARLGVEVARVAWPSGCDAKDANELALAGRIGEIGIEEKAKGLRIGRAG